MEVYHDLCSLSNIGLSPFITIFKRSEKDFPHDDVLSKYLLNKAIFLEVAANRKW